MSDFPVKYLSQQKNKKSFLEHFQVGGKITVGYFIALGMAILGTASGLLIGEYYQGKAFKVAEVTQHELELLHQLQTAVLQSRTHQQQLIPLAENPQDFREEYDHILQHAQSIRRIWSDLISLSQEFANQEDLINGQGLNQFLLTYRNIPDQYLQQLDIIVNQVEPKILVENQGFQEAQKQLLEFTNSDLALSFDGISDDLVGMIEINYDLNESAKTTVRQASQIRIWLIVISLSGSISLAAMMAVVVSRAITQPLKDLTKVAKQVTDNSNFDLQAVVTTNDEIGILAMSLNQLIEKVKLLLLENDTRTQNLIEANEKLVSTQKQLITQERLAALGSLTAGIAHEINTPLGISISAASAVEEDTRAMRQRFGSGKMKRSDLSNFFETIEESSAMLLGNLRRAAELIQSFKQVAVDQSSEKQRSFEVKEYLQEILVQLTPTLKKTRHTIKVEGQEYLSINSYPGAFSQIITNLVMNSLAHGYEAGDSGVMEICFEQQNENLVLTYSDDGKGISPENLKQIFDPFFTTKRNQGGNGLGLHIVYNLVTQKLLGTITCDSQVGVGTKFTIHIPLNLNMVNESASVTKKEELKTV